MMWRTAAFTQWTRSSPTSLQDAATAEIAKSEVCCKSYKWVIRSGWWVETQMTCRWLNRLRLTLVGKGCYQTSNPKPYQNISRLIDTRKHRTYKEDSLHLTLRNKLLITGLKSTSRHMQLISDVFVFSLTQINDHAHGWPIVPRDTFQRSASGTANDDRRPV